MTRLAASRLRASADAFSFKKSSLRISEFFILGFRETTTRANRDFMTSEYFSVTVGLATDNEISYFSYIYGLSRSSLMELKILR